jgi:protein disulfide-isomerase A1
MLRPVAEKYKSKMNFVWIDAIKFGDHGKALNLQESKWPSFVIQNMEKQLKYPFDQSKDVTPEGISDWVTKYLDGKLEPSLKSQPIPAEQNEAVYTLVGKSFEDVVYDDSKDVFIEFYASWCVLSVPTFFLHLMNYRCGHCKRLAPIWESFAEKYADRKDRLIM